MRQIRWKEHWAAIRRHKLFVVLVLIFAPLVGQLINPEHGFLFGWLVSIVAVIWLWGEGRA